MSDLLTTKFVRIPFEVDGVRVTSDNIEQVAAWCEGELVSPMSCDRSTEASLQHIKVRVLRPITERQTKAYIGDYVLRSGANFKVYTPQSFAKNFEVAGKKEFDCASRAGVAENLPTHVVEINDVLNDRLIPDVTQPKPSSNRITPGSVRRPSIRPIFSVGPDVLDAKTDMSSDLTGIVDESDLAEVVFPS